MPQKQKTYMCIDMKSFYASVECAERCLDITAKHAKDHMGYLDEELYRKTLWDHKPLTDFWQISRAARQEPARPDREDGIFGSRKKQRI